MLFLVLGKGKTGSLVAEIAHDRGHGVRALDIYENKGASAITAPTLAGVDAVTAGDGVGDRRNVVAEIERRSAVVDRDRIVAEIALIDRRVEAAMAASLRWAGFLSMSVSRRHPIPCGEGIIYRLRSSGNQSVGSPSPA